MFLVCRFIQIILGWSLVLLAWPFHSPGFRFSPERQLSVQLLAADHLKVGDCLSRSHSSKTFRQLPCRSCAQSTASEQMKLDFLAGSIWNLVPKRAVLGRPFRSEARRPRLHLYHGKARATGPQSAPKSGQGKRLY